MHIYINRSTHIYIYITLQGDGWEHVAQLQSLRTFLVDYFRGDTAEALSTIGVERVLAFSASGAGWAEADATAGSGKTGRCVYICYIIYICI